MFTQRKRVVRALKRVLWPRRSPGDESGMALILVVGTMLILSLFASAALAYSTTSLRLSRHDQDFAAALGAAQAGVSDYIRHLNDDDDYYRTPDCDAGPVNDALIGPNGPDCYESATPGWTYVNGDGATNPQAARFHYDIDWQTLNSSHYITVTSTGEVNGVSRTIQAQVGRGGSTDFVYYTDFEDADPSNKVVYPDGAPADCQGVYWWQGRSGCVEIRFVGGDVLNGPVHTNDTPLMDDNSSGDGPEFKGGPNKQYSLESHAPDCQTATASDNYLGCWRYEGSSWNEPHPQFDRPAGYGDLLQLPDNSAQLATDPGCQYVGQTRIRFTGDGNMLVWSPETTSLNSTTTGDCGGDSPNGASVPVPEGEVVYAANNPDVAAHQCAANEIGDGLPIAGDITMETTDQYCGQGNVYVEGTLEGRVTVGAENSIVVTGDLLLKNGPTGNDILGLVAGNSVEVMHPWIDTVAATCPAGTDSHDTTEVRTPGKWVTAGSGGASPQPGQVWEGEQWSDSGGGWHVSQPGQWVTQPTNWKGRAELWQAGYWSTNWHGDLQWNDGKWVTKSGNYGDDSQDGWQRGANGTYWQGESWSVQSNCYGESSTWPHTSVSGKIQIFGSIQTLQHSFWVQNYQEGTHQGTLYVLGSIAQKYRGIVGQGDADTGTGYLKSYNYDSRLVTQSPPYFPQWQNAKWATERFGEITPQYH